MTLANQSTASSLEELWPNAEPNAPDPGSSAALAAYGAQLDAHFGVGLVVLQEQPLGTRHVLLARGVGSGGVATANTMARTLRDLDPETYQELVYRRRMRASACGWLAYLPASSRSQVLLAIRSAGACDALLLLAHPARDYVAALVVPLSHEAKRPDSDEQLAQVRRRLEHEVRSGLLPRHCACACIQANGTPVDHGEPPPLSRADLWEALSTGRATLSASRDAQGSPFYLVFENSPLVAPARALSATERTVIDQTLEGRMAKTIAYSLGVSGARVSDSLIKAARKFGVDTRTELISVCAGLRMEERPAYGAPALTPAEDAVLKLIKEGLSNREIAGRRNTSLCTVANQVASLLRKTGAAGRRGLVLSFGSLRA